MDKFIEKLIGRLEEEAFDCTVAKDYVPQVVELDCIKEIVNELAEKYKQCALCYLQSPCEYQNENAEMPMEYWERGWIPCDENLPNHNQTVIFQTEDGMVETGYYDVNEDWCVNDSYFPNAFRFIAWQPLPEPYNQKGE